MGDTDKSAEQDAPADREMAIEYAEERIRQLENLIAELLFKNEVLRYRSTEKQ